MKAMKLIPIAMCIAFALTGCNTGPKQASPNQEVKSGDRVTSDAEIDKTGVKTNKIEPSDYKIVTLRAYSNDKSAPARVYNLVEAADRLNKKLEKEGSKERVKVEATLAEAKDDIMRQNIIFASQSGSAAEIYALAFDNIGWMADGNYVQPLDGIEKDPMFANLMDGYWNATKWKGQIYGVIQDTEARSIIFNKDLLKKLGWTDAQIAELPEKTNKGEFTLDDMAKVGKEAVDKGLVEKGFGFTHDGGKQFLPLFQSFSTTFYDDKNATFTFDSQAVRKTLEWTKKWVDNGVINKDGITMGRDETLKRIVNDQVLFMIAGTWDEAKFRTKDWVVGKGNLTVEETVKKIGVMAVPAAEKGGKPNVLSHPQVYTVAKGSPNGNRVDLIKRLLIEVSASDIQVTHALQSAHIPFTKEAQELPEVKANPWIQLQTPLTKYSWFVPSHPQWAKYSDVLQDAGINVEGGKMSVDEAVKYAQDQIKLNVGSNLTIK